MLSSPEEEGVFVVPDPDSLGGGSPIKLHEETPDGLEVVVPSVRQILAFAVPAVAIYLLSPLLSVIDTSTVGIFAGTAQQAALNPATAVADYSARGLVFLYAGTTHMISSSHRKSRKETAETFFGALQLSLWVGLGLGAALLLFSDPLLRGIIGNDTIDPEIFGAASRYVKIRSLGLPAAALLGTAQAACLGMKDVKSPIFVLSVAGVVNLVLDVLFVTRTQSWLGGAAGAAWATSISQYVSAFLFLRWLKGSSSTTTTTIFGNKKKIMPHDPQSTHGILATEFKRQSLWRSVPSASIRKGFRPYVLPVTTTQVGRCSTYVAMGYVVSSCLGTVSMAANQIITSVFYSLIPIADSLGLTAQSFLPGILASSSSSKNVGQNAATPALVGRFIRNLSVVAGMVGLKLAAIVLCIPSLCPLFTTDPAVISMVVDIVPVLLAIFSLHGVFCASEGLLLGQQDLKFLGRIYACFFAVVPALMIRLGHASLQSVWTLFLYYQYIRIAAFVGRVALLQVRRCRAIQEEVM